MWIREGGPYPHTRGSVSTGGVDMRDGDDGDDDDDDDDSDGDGGR